MVSRTINADKKRAWVSWLLDSVPFPAHAENWGSLLFLWVYPLINNPLLYSTPGYFRTLLRVQIGTHRAWVHAIAGSCPVPTCSTLHSTQFNYPSEDELSLWHSWARLVLAGLPWWLGNFPPVHACVALSSLLSDWVINAHRFLLQFLCCFSGLWAKNYPCFDFWQNVQCPNWTRRIQTKILSYLAKMG